MNAPLLFPVEVSAVRHPRAGFENLPVDLTRTELFCYFTFSDKDREETLARATAALVNFQLQQPLAQKWGQGLTSSSDARVYGVPVRALNATFHPKSFASAGRGINVYTHIFAKPGTRCCGWSLQSRPERCERR